MCLRFWDTLLVGGFTNGRIIIYNAKSGAKMIEIVAHARSINALDVAPDSGRVSISALFSFLLLSSVNYKFFLIFLTTD